MWINQTTSLSSVGQGRVEPTICPILLEQLNQWIRQKQEIT